MTRWLQQAGDWLRQGQPERALDALRQARALDLRCGLELGQALLFLDGRPPAVAEAEQTLLAAEAEVPAAGYWLAWLALGAAPELAGAAALRRRLQAAAAAGVAPAMRALALWPQALADGDANSYAQQLQSRQDPIALLLAERRSRGSQTHAAACAQLATCGLMPLPELAADGPTRLPAPSLAALLDPGTAVSLHAEPTVERCQSLFDGDECGYLIAAGRPLLQRSQVYQEDDGQRQALPIRTSRDASFDFAQEDLVLRLLQARMAAAAGARLRQAEPLILLHYAPGEQYRPHRDYLAPSALRDFAPEAGQRWRTVCAYLNPVQDGGATHFPLIGRRVEARAGEAVVFDNLDRSGQPEPRSLHAGEPVRRGEKWLATLWLRQRPLRPF